MLSKSSQARFTLLVLAMLAVAGIALGWNSGKLPRGRESIPPTASQSASDEFGIDSRPLRATNKIAPTPPDLQLYREIVAEVHVGHDYYDVARAKLPEFGFPIASPFNWRLPTYAWLWSLLPGPAWIQGLLIALAVVALALAFIAESRSSGLGYAAITTFLLLGVVRWAVDGDAYFAQEVWAGTLLVTSISAYRLGEASSMSTVQGPKSGIDANRPEYSVLSTQYGVPSRSIAWPCLAIGTGLSALAFRELALPYCCVACVVSLFHCRWWQAAAWTVGIGAFFAFLAWHIGQVHIQLAGTEAAGGAGLVQWLRFGGLDFVLLTTRMNSLLFAAPGWLLWLYIVAALIGLARRNDPASQLACLAALAYLAAFAIVGRPENFYWGLMAAPLLPWGVAHAPRAIAELWSQSRPGALDANRQPSLV